MNPVPNNIGTIQSLRGVAALMIVVFHLDVQLVRLGMPANAVPGLAAGVDIFFVISGFIMWITTATRPDRTPSHFIRDRIVRVAPLYWFITLVMALLLIVTPSLLQTAEYDFDHILKSLLFVPAPSPIDRSYVPLLVPGWTLNYEMFFYLIFGAAIGLARTNLRRRAMIIMGSLIALFGIGLVFPVSGVSHFYTRDIILEFGLGLMIGIIYLREKQAHSRWWWVPVGAGFSLIAASSFIDTPLPRSVRWGLPSAMIVAGAVFAKPHAFPALERLGLWSYALYLTHPLVLSASSQLWQVTAFRAALSWFPLIAVAACIMVAAATYRFLERPLTRAFKKMMIGKPRQVSHKA